MLTFVIAGIVAGSIYGLAATGLVLTYKTSGIFNFGQGALATAGAYVFYAMYSNGMLWLPAALITVFVVGPVLGVLLETLARRLTPQRTVWKIVGTLGIVAFVQGVAAVVFGRASKPVTNFLPGGFSSFDVFGTNLRYTDLGIVVFTVVAVGALQVLFRRTRMGIQMRAVVENPDLADLQGTNPARVRRVSWVLSTCLTTLSGILLLPAIGLDPVLFTYLFLTTFAAAALGMFDSVAKAYAGGILIGVVTSILTNVEYTFPTFGGVSAAAPFIILILVMLVSPRRKLLPMNAVEKRPAPQWEGPPRLRMIMLVVVFALLASVPLWASASVLVPYWASAMVFTVFFLALGMLVHRAGLLCLCMLTFAAIGAVASGHLGTSVPWVVAVLVAGLIAMPVGALVALPGIRLSGAFLALSTLGFALVVQYLFYPRSWMFGELFTGLATPRPSFARSDEAYYYVLLAAVAVAVSAIAAINRSRLGRMLTGMNEASGAVATLGLDVNRVRLLVFSIGAFFAAVGGALYSPIFGFANSDQYLPLQSLVLLATLCVLPFRAPWYAIFGGVTQVIPGYLVGDSTTDVMNAVFGLSAVLVAVQGGVPSMPLAWRRALESAFGSHRRPGTAATPGAADDETAGERTRRKAQGTGLVVDGVTVRFGGLVAVSGVSLEAPLGRVTALIGPNGAGKTTLFNTCSGLVKPTAGSVALDGQVMRAGPHARAQAGLGRTFQLMQLCESLSVVDNVGLGREAGQAGSNPWTQLRAGRAERRERDEAVREAIELCDLTDIADQQAGTLSTGQRRRVEFARCLAGDFDVLLLDEPSSGLGPDETLRFGAVLRRVVAERNCGILLVEHDMSLVMDVCDYVYVVDFGKLIFEGTPDQARHSAIVRAAYLGGGDHAVEALQDVAVPTASGEAFA